MNDRLRVEAIRDASAIDVTDWFWESALAANFANRLAERSVQLARRLSQEDTVDAVRRSVHMPAPNPPQQPAPSPVDSDYRFRGELLDRYINPVHEMTVPPEQPTGPRVLRNTVLATALALMIACCSRLCQARSQRHAAPDADGTAWTHGSGTLRRAGGQWHVMKQNRDGASAW